MTTQRRPRLHPLEIDRWMLVNRVYHQFTACLVLLGLASVITWLNYHYDGLAGHVVFSLLSTALLILPLLIARCWVKRSFRALRSHRVALQTAGIGLALALAVSIDYDRMSLRALLVLAGFAAFLAGVGALIVYTTSPRACRAQIEAADDGYYN